jgi:Tat protein translocase TatB subunit
MGFFDIGIVEIIVVLIVALLIIGPDKIPDYLRRFGKLVRTFKKMTSNLTDPGRRSRGTEKVGRRD